MESPRFLPPRKLGVGFPYLANLPAEFYERRDLLDFVEVTPELLCREVGHGELPRLDFVPDQLEQVLRATAGLPVVVHGVELSIGSESGWSEAYIEVLDRFHRQQAFVWHSEHLGFMLAETPDGKTINAGVPLPVPFTNAGARSHRASGRSTRSAPTMSHSCWKTLCITCLVCRPTLGEMKSRS